MGSLVQIQQCAPFQIQLKFLFRPAQAMLHAMRILLFILCSQIAATLAAAEFPSQPLTVIVPFNAEAARWNISRPT